MNQTAPFLELRQAARVYQSGEILVHALRPTSLTLEAGEFVVLFGPSGSGKSTLLNLLGGIDEPSSGEVLFQGQPLLGEATLEEHRRHRVGFVFQFYNLIPSLTALENVEMATLLSPGSLSASDALARVGLEPRKDHFPSQLSGGEQQRVSIARALAKRPSLLLCDEPTGALDPETGRRVLGLLRDIHANEGTTVVIVTHNGALAEIADRIVRLRGGEVVADERDLDPVPPEKIAW